MDIVVHGTKGGRKIFTPKKIGGLLDISADASERSAMGKEAFAIRFVENNIIFSKYKIVRDVLGAKRTGFIGFSLFLSNDEKLSGSEVATLLNRVSEAYGQKYIPENDNNLNDVRENWTFLDRIEKEYRPKVETLSPDDVETQQSGTKNDAFIYYKDDTELQKYFDMPYEDEYKPYRQVLFVKEGLKGRPENPLKAIRHSEDNLTGKIDLENPKYKLVYDEKTKTGVKIEVKVKGKTHDGKSKVRKKDELEISWSKPYYKTVTERGKCSDIGSKFIEANDSLRRVSIKEITLQPETKNVIFRTIDYRRYQVTDAEIICKSNGQRKTISNNQAVFKGEELGKKWTVTAKKGGNFESIEQYFTPEHQNSPVEITLHEHKTVKFMGRLKESNRHFPDIEITISGKKINNNTRQVDFKDGEIDQKFEVTAGIFDRNGNSFKGKQTFIPRKGDIVAIELKKIKKYRIDAGEKGRLSASYPGYYLEDDGNDPKSYIKPNKGWKFTRFESFESNKNKTKDYDGTLIAQYEKRNFFVRSEGLITSAAVVLVLCFGIWFFKSGTTEKNIKAYVDGTELFDNKLNALKKQWNSQEPKIKTKGILSMLRFGNKEEKKDSTAYKDWEKFSKSIDSAREKRKHINSHDFDVLKTLRYSAKQQKFKDAIKKIDSTQYGALKGKLKNQDFSSWDLNKIADAVISAVSGEIEKNITAYVEGTELFNEKLTELEKQWDLQKPEIKIEKKSWLSMFWRGNKREKKDSTAYKDWEKVLHSIDSAIAKRKHIDSLNFDSLRTLRYYEKQQKFKDAIKNMDSAQYGALKDKLKNQDFSSLNLNQIADSICVFLNPSVIGDENQVRDKDKKAEQPSSGQEQKPVENTKPTTENKTPAQDIGKELQSGTVSKKQLQDWQGAGMDKYKKSIALYLRFWDNVYGDSSQKEGFDQLLKEVKSDKCLKTSKLKTFLDGICANPEAFQKYNDASGKKNCKNINQLNDKIR